MQKDQETSQPTREVGQDALGLILRVERSDVHVSPGRDASGLSDEWCTEDLVRVSVFIACSGSGPANEDFPLVEDDLFLRDLRPCDIPNPTVPINLEVISRLLLFPPEGTVEPKCADRAD